MIRLSKKHRQAITDWAKKVKRHSLYSALHDVGDDPVKSLIEDVLRQELPDKTFRRVVAIFMLASSWEDDNPWNED